MHRPYSRLHTQKLRLSKWWNDKKLGFELSNKRKESQQFLLLLQLLQVDIKLWSESLTPQEFAGGRGPLAIEYPGSSSCNFEEEKNSKQEFEDELDIDVRKGWRIEVYFEKQGENRSFEFWAEGEITQTNQKMFFVKIEGEESLAPVKKSDMHRWRIIV